METIDWVIMICQCRFIYCDKCTFWLGILIIGKAVCVWAGGIWELSVPSSQFDVNLKLL